METVTLFLRPQYTHPRKWTLSKWAPHGTLSVSWATKQRKIRCTNVIMNAWSLAYFCFCRVLKGQTTCSFAENLDHPGLWMTFPLRLSNQYVCVWICVYVHTLSCRRVQTRVSTGPGRRLMHLQLENPYRTPDSSIQVRLPTSISSSCSKKVVHVWSKNKFTLVNMTVKWSLRTSAWSAPVWFIMES